MKINGALVKMLVQISLKVCKDYLVIEGKIKTLYVEMLKALIEHATMIALILQNILKRNWSKN
jgi:hypothetical protein